ncbi:cytoplasmic dynein 2 intermediate chain 1-like [Pollicipes pollicipes]|uniref:cytoplasmic dynein 2 intermediate chain 1-like n=1 Tax=Pollicipes pollicipes TaxID=41117 RepID=UPI00188523A5|nr:cytoplasmic dynein 2 intermediate chain 1-like [Pollicipes pollicipes]
MSARQQANLEVLDGDLGMAPWGRVKLVKISHVTVDDFLDARTCWLAGADGSLRLHTTSGDRPLITWNNATAGAPVLALGWSRSRPCVFFVLDADSKIHVWDLSAGDIFPAETDEVKSGQVTAMDLSYGAEGDKPVTHLAVCTDAGTVEVHRISETYTSATDEAASTEMEQFLHYVQII